MDSTNRTADIVVIGAGSGGAAAASVLARSSDANVILVEAGPDYGSFKEGRWPADLLDARSIPLSHDYDLREGQPGTPGALDLPRARVLGGCSSHNGCTASIGARADYDEWVELGNDGWSSTPVLPLLEWVRERFRVRRYALNELTYAQRAFVQAGINVGLPFADDLDDIEAAIGIGPMPTNVRDGIRWNAAFAFLDEVRALPNLTIIPNSSARRIRFDGTRAVGVDILSEGQPSYIAAPQIVVACGAYLSPALLQNSGVGDAGYLRDLGVDPIVDLRGVGRNLLDHACVQLDFHGEPEFLSRINALPWAPDEQTVARTSSTLCDDGPYDTHMFLVAGANSGHPGLPPISVYGGAMKAKSQGVVRLTEQDSVETPLIDHRYGTDSAGHDRQVLQEALAFMETLVADREFAAILGARANGGGNPLTRIVSYCHPAGTAKMGPDTDPLAVAAADGSVHGVDGVFVADASLMPTITRGNINLPTAMIGARVASGILRREPIDLVDDWTSSGVER